MTSSILSIILTTCVANWNYYLLDKNDSYTPYSFISGLPVFKQSIPILGFPFSIYNDLASATASIGHKPLLSAKAIGICSRASAKALTAYYSTFEISSAAF